ncbi:hypothetical protein NG799_02070 [Laspinema sp. D1]|uniref:N-acetyltransferase domain-containing protein n=1 Tax=Laspinema palackyanum D2a TaxID=2953684 RepID=A0ABT2MK37_9CYAN|nr:hypothetical protein [Laspinema sp. D2a]
MELSEEIKAQFLEFLSKTRLLKNRWISDEKMKVYLRISCRNRNNQVQHFLDIAAIEVDKKYRFQGLGKQFLQFCRSNSPYPVMVENCNNPHLRNHLEKQGWIQVDFDYYAPD